MGYKDVMPGTKTGRAFRARFVRSEKGTDGIEVAFRFQEPSTRTDEVMNWVGWLSDAARDNTMKTLVEVLEYDGSMDTNSEGIFTGARTFNWDKDISLVIENEPHEGKDRMKIKWVNNVGGSAFQGCVPESIKSGPGAAAFRASFLAAKAKIAGNGLSGVGSQARSGMMTQKSFNEEDLNF